MSNVTGKAYAMNVVTPMRPCWTWLNRALFMVSRAIPTTLRGLLGLSIIHFARWVIIKRDQWPDLGQGKQSLQNDYMLFCSNFNGTWDQYIDAFSDAIPGGLDLLWYSSTRYPHSIPISPFKSYIRVTAVEMRRARAAGKPLLADLDELLDPALEPGCHHDPFGVPAGAEIGPPPDVAPHRPVVDQLGDGDAVELGCRDRHEATLSQASCPRLSRASTPWHRRRRG